MVPEKEDEEELTRDDEAEEVVPMKENEVVPSSTKDFVFVVGLVNAVPFT